MLTRLLRKLILISLNERASKVGEGKIRREKGSRLVQSSQTTQSFNFSLARSDTRKPIGREALTIYLSDNLNGIAILMSDCSDGVQAPHGQT